MALVHIYLRTDPPVRIEDEDSNILITYESVNPVVIAGFLNSVLGGCLHVDVKDGDLYYEISNHLGVRGEEYSNTDWEFLPEGYVFHFGKHTGKRKEDVPDWYIKWFEKEIPRSRWYQKT